MNTLAQQIKEAVAQFAANDLAYTDNLLVVIDPAAGTATLLDPDEEADIEAIIDADTVHDYVSVMDLVEATADGGWMPDDEAIASVVADYE